MYFFNDVSRDKEYQNIENIIQTQERDVTMVIEINEAHVTTEFNNKIWII